MRFSEWEPVYRRICADMGYEPSADEASARLLAALTLNSDLRDGDAVEDMMKSTATVIGNSPGLEKDILKHPPEGTIIVSGSAVGRAVAAGVEPDIVVTDLDGDIAPQIEASRRGALTLLHAHGDNAGLIQRYAGEFEGPVVLTTQGRPFGNVFDFGGFTDGDRAYCLAREFGARRVLLLGFDFDNPMPKEGSDPAVKLRKLAWARKIIFDGSGAAVLPRSRMKPIYVRSGMGCR